MKKLLLIIFLSFLIIRVDALSYKGCDYKTVSNLKKLVNNINISYDYNLQNEVAYFDITITNIPANTYFIDSYSDKMYTSENINNGEIIITGYNNNSGRYDFYSADGNCYGVNLGMKYYKFPIYNIYWNDDICNEFSNSKICQKWVEERYGYNKIVETIDEYKKSLAEKKENNKQMASKPTFIDKIVGIYIRYYYIFLPIIIFACMIYIFINNKKNKFKL